MNYFNEYNFEKNTKYGKLIIKNNDYYVNDINVENNRGIINDIVYYDNNKIINVKERSNQSIIGIVNLDSKTKFRIKNKNYYLFKPLNKDFPDFLVTMKSKFNNKIYCLVKFIDWPTNSKNPYCNLIEIIGKVGDKDSEYKSLMYYNNIFNKSWKINPDKIKEDENIINSISNYDYNIFTIDPKGSKDLDDGFSYEYDDQYIHLGIHISNPSKFLNKFMDKIMERTNTIYLNNNINMIPKIYSEDLCSLIENKYRYCISLILKFDKYYNLIEKKNLKKLLYL